jgi:hypothetical protein
VWAVAAPLYLTEKMLAKITIGWHWLERTLNAIIEEVNRQKPLASASIVVEESPNGALLKVVEQQAQAAAATGGAKTTWPAGVGWQPMTVIQTTGSGSCVTNYIWYWGTGATGVQTPAPPNPQ